MIEALKGNRFEYTKLTPEEQKERCILGTLYGPIADTKKPTRNGRIYPKEAWENALNNEIFQEQLQSKCILGELEHPDRDAIDPREACVALASTPKIGSDGLLYGEFHILDLPNGRILKTLCDYGTIVGVSSRGNGDLVEDYEGNDSVDPETFDLTTWDVVLLPAVKEARQAYVRESLDKNRKSLKESLDSLLSNSEGKDKKIMEETMKKVNEKLNEGLNTQETKSEDINEVKSDNTLVANDNGTTQIINSLTEALKDKANLENTIKELQEQLAVRDSKVNKLQEELDKYKDTTSRLTSIATKSKNLSKDNSQLQEQLDLCKKEIEELKSKNSKLIEQKRENISTKKTLNESIAKQSLDNKKLNEQLEQTSKQLDNQKKLYEAKINSIKNDNDAIQKELNDKIESLRESVTKKSKLVEGYKKLANDTVDKYIQFRALMLGVSKNEIKNRLPESYNLSDIDVVCEKLQDYSLNISKLPFDLRESKNNSLRVKIKSQEDDLLSNLTPNKKYDDADEVDESLLKLASQV